MTHRLRQILTNRVSPQCARQNPCGEENLFQTEPTEAKHQCLARTFSMRSSGQFDRHLDCLPDDATNRPRKSRVEAIADHRVANHEVHSRFLGESWQGKGSRSCLKTFPRTAAVWRRGKRTDILAVIGARSDAAKIRQYTAYHRRVSASQATKHMEKCPGVADFGRSGPV